MKWITKGRSWRFSSKRSKRMETVAIATLGCKVNQFESEALVNALEKQGYRIISLGAAPDIAIINTCTVTHRADFQSRQMVRRAYQSNPNGLLIVTGCYPQVSPDAFSKMKGELYLLGNREKRKIPEFLPRMKKGEFPKMQIGDIQQETHFAEIPLDSFRHHTRAFFKIQDGCNAHCSYCIVPYARGPSRSLAPQRVTENLKRLKERGFREVVLTGIHLGAYGKDLIPPFSLEKLIRQLEEVETPDRIRLSSIEPGDFSPGLISTFSQSSKICPHLHISIQSGDDEILKKMERDYPVSFLSDLIQELHGKISNLSIGADVIVGFPGETEDHFKNTYRMVESLPFAYLHVFPFSRREKTAAYQFPQRVNEKEIKKRAEALRELGRRKRQVFYRQFLHQELSVLIEKHHEKEAHRWKGLSQNYIPVFLELKNGNGKREDWVNSECTVRVTGWMEKGLMGEVLEKDCG